MPFDQKLFMKVGGIEEFEFHIQTHIIYGLHGEQVSVRANLTHNGKHYWTTIPIDKSDKDGECNAEFAAFREIKRMVHRQEAEGGLTLIHYRVMIWKKHDSVWCDREPDVDLTLLKPVIHDENENEALPIALRLCGIAETDIDNVELYDGGPYKLNG